MAKKMQCSRLRQGREVDDETLFAYCEQAWNENSEHALKMMFYIRDCRGGKGERALFRRMMKWLYNKSPANFNLNLHLIPLYGRWDDVILLPGGLQLMAQQLKRDRTELERLRQDPKHAVISWCAKWAPTANHSLDCKFGVVRRLLGHLGLLPNTYGFQIYRTKYLVPLRKHLRTVVEDTMQQYKREWSNISIDNSIHSDRYDPIVYSDVILLTEKTDTDVDLLEMLK